MLDPQQPNFPMHILHTVLKHFQRYRQGEFSQQPRSCFFNLPTFDLFFMRLMFDSKGAIRRKNSSGTLWLKRLMFLG